MLGEQYRNFGSTEELVVEHLELQKGQRVRQVRDGMELEVGDITINLLCNIRSSQ